MTPFATQATIPNHELLVLLFERLERDLAGATTALWELDGLGPTASRTTALTTVHDKVSHALDIITALTQSLDSTVEWDTPSNSALTPADSLLFLYSRWTAELHDVQTEKATVPAAAAARTTQITSEVHGISESFAEAAQQYASAPAEVPVV